MAGRQAAKNFVSSASVRMKFYYIDNNNERTHTHAHTG